MTLSWKRRCWSRGSREGGEGTRGSSEDSDEVEEAHEKKEAPVMSPWRREEKSIWAGGR